MLDAVGEMVAAGADAAGAVVEDGYDGVDFREEGEVGVAPVVGEFGEGPAPGHGVEEGDAALFGGGGELFQEGGAVRVEVAGAGFLEWGDGGIGDRSLDAAVVADVGRGVAVVFSDDNAGGEGGEVAGSGAREVEEFARGEAAVEGFSAGG